MSHWVQGRGDLAIPAAKGPDLKGCELLSVPQLWAGAILPFQNSNEWIRIVQSRPETRRAGVTWPSQICADKFCADKFCLVSLTMDRSRAGAILPFL